MPFFTTFVEKSICVNYFDDIFLLSFLFFMYAETVVMTEFFCF